MIKSDKISPETVLDRDTLELIGGAVVRADVPAERLAPLRDRVMNRVAEEKTTPDAYTTIRADAGRWIEIGPRLEKKVLSINNETGIESYLLRLHPGANLDRHHHDQDELCVVLEGDVSFDDVHLEAGDFHLARKGSWHGRASTVHGALVFLQSGVAATQLTA